MVRDDVLWPPDLGVVDEGHAAVRHRLVHPRPRGECRVRRLVYRRREHQPLRIREDQGRHRVALHPARKADSPEHERASDARPVLRSRLVLRGAVEVLLERALPDDVAVRLLPGQVRSGCDRHRCRPLGRDCCGRGRQLHGLLAHVHEAVHARRLPVAFAALDEWQHALRLDAATQIGLGHRIENIRCLFTREEVNRVEGAGHIESIRPLQDVASSWVLVCPRAHVHPFAINPQVNGLDLRLYRHDATQHIAYHVAGPTLRRDDRCRQQRQRRTQHCRNERVR
eukprot:5577795-Prymnesium_polylepis.1